MSRSAIVNIARVREVQTWFDGDYIIVTRGGAKVPTTRRYRDQLRTLLGR